MDIENITQNIGDYTSDSILVTEAEPIVGDGPRIVWCNPQFERMTGYTLAEIKGKNPRFLQGPASPRAPLDRISAALETWQPVVEIVQNYTKSGDLFFAELSITPVADAAGHYRFWVSVQRDVTERVLSERALKSRNKDLLESERVLQEESARLAGIAAAAEHAQELITITNLDFRILWANPAFAKRSGYSLAAIRGAYHCDLVHKRSLAHPSRKSAAKAVIAGSVISEEVCNTDRMGREYWTDVRITVQRDDLGTPERFVVVEREITEQRKQLLDLERSRSEVALAAIRDQLTGLPNRRGFEQAMERMAADAERHGYGMAMMHLGLDRFKQINDTLGHTAGDAVLCTVTERLMRFLGPDSFAARIGGDEFAICYLVRNRSGSLETVAELLRKEVAEPIEFEKAECRFGASIGLVIQDEGPFDGDAMLMKADIALYRAKGEGRNLVRCYDSDLEMASRRRKAIADELGMAIECGEIRVLYQPQVDAKTFELTGLEALVRWDHPRLGLLVPDQFLPIAREMSLERELD
ncbi:MAG: diguanylate cyclase, partial [Pseudomonadota bacterium]